jgi:diguanylate cyclase (GGDEF)-like protein/PAS domain S-box-containing protein
MNSAHPKPDLQLFDADALPCMVLRVATDGRVLHTNRAFNEFFEVDKAAGTSWPDMLAVECRAAAIEALQAREYFSLIVRVRRDDGSPGGEAWFDCQARWLPDAEHYLCVLTDVTQGKRAELSARARAEQFQLLADNVPALIASFTIGSFRCLFANKRYASTFGWDEDAIVGHTVAEIIGEEAAREIQPHIERALDERRAVSYERELQGPDGLPRWLHVHLVPHYGPDGRAEAGFVLISDITQRRLAERSLRESEERLATFLQASIEGIAFHKDGIITDATPPLCALSGYTLEELVGRHALSFVTPDQVARASAVLQANDEISYDSAVIHKDGSRLPVEFIVRTMMRNGERIRMTIVRDIRDRVAAQERIYHLAHHDALTGLPNRMSLMMQLEHMIADARRNDSQLALLFIDLDHFKRVNDSLGHLVGDTLLQTIARRITESLRSTDLVARFGGDEFIVLLPSTLQRMDIEEVAQKLLAAIEVPVTADNRLISVTPSIGISMYPNDGETADELIKNADTAMYLAKSRGRANFSWFTSEMASLAYQALVMESQLLGALERGEFVLAFQPQIRAKDGVLVGVEALIRWRHPERGMLQPDSFISLAEKQRVMLPIGQWVLREAARCGKRWRAEGLTSVPIAVNLSTMQFQASGFAALIQQMLMEEGVTGELLELELTERMLMDDLPEVKRKLTELKTLGLRISVDDFGTGYSSLAHLKELPIDKMKIDRSFVHDLPGQQDSAAIVRAIIQMARSLGLSVIAEGVETEAQRSFLSRLDCDELQGLLISAPLEMEAFEAWVRQHEPSVALGVSV